MRRYKGTVSYESEDKTKFFGREEDLEKVESLLDVNNHVVIYGKSGVGKSSFINAKVLDKLKEKDFQALSIRFLQVQEKELLTPIGVFMKNVEIIINSDNASVKAFSELPLNTGMLWQSLKTLQLASNQYNKGKILLIFDQFEDFFSNRYQIEDIFEFAEQISYLLNWHIPHSIISEYELAIKQNPALETVLEPFQNDIFKPLEIKALFSIREDRFSNLKIMETNFPSVLDNCYELAPLDEKQARQVISLPPQLEGNFESPKYDIANSAEDKIIRSLLTSSEGHNGIEAWQLQIICEHIEKNIIDLKQKGKLVHDPVIEENSNLIDLDFNNIFKKYYIKEVLGNLKEESEKSRAQKIIESLIIDEERSVKDILRIKKENEDVPSVKIDSLLNFLIEKRILSREKNSIGYDIYEISHSTLVKPILDLQRKQRQKMFDKKTRDKYLKIFIPAALIFAMIGYIGSIFFKNIVTIENQQVIIDSQKESMANYNAELKNKDSEIFILEDSIESLLLRAQFVDSLLKEKEQKLTASLDSIYQEELKRNRQVRLNSPEGKSASWFKDQERIDKWWLGLSNPWRDEFKNNHIDQNKDFYEEVKRIMKVNVIRIRNDKITDLEGLSNLTELRQILVESSNLSSFDGIKGLNNLVKIVHSSDKLSDKEINRHSKRITIEKK